MDSIFHIRPALPYLFIRINSNDVIMEITLYTSRVPKPTLMIHLYQERSNSSSCHLQARKVWIRRNHMSLTTKNRIKNCQIWIRSAMAKGGVVFFFYQGRI